MYKFIGLSGFSASRKRSCATIDAEVGWSTSPLRHIIRSLDTCQCLGLVLYMGPSTFRSREKISSVSMSISLCCHNVRSRDLYMYAMLLPAIISVWHSYAYITIIQLSLSHMALVSMTAVVLCCLEDQIYL
jgi:hypothetical protein